MCVCERERDRIFSEYTSYVHTFSKVRTAIKTKTYAGLLLTAVYCCYLLIRLVTTIRDHYPRITQCNKPGSYVTSSDGCFKIVSIIEILAIYPF